MQGWMSCPLGKTIQHSLLLLPGSGQGALILHSLGLTSHPEAPAAWNRVLGAPQSAPGLGSNYQQLLSSPQLCFASTILMEMVFWTAR